MRTWIALLRGINADLKSTNEFEEAIATAIEKDHGFRPAIHFVSVEALH